MHRTYLKACNPVGPSSVIHDSQGKLNMSKSKLFLTFVLQPFLIPDFNNPFLVMGTGMENCIPKFWEQESERKMLFTTNTFMRASYRTFDSCPSALSSVPKI